MIRPAIEPLGLARRESAPEEARQDPASPALLDEDDAALDPLRASEGSNVHTLAPLHWRDKIAREGLLQGA